jgi:hypothetical protein
MKKAGRCRLFALVRRIPALALIAMPLQYLPVVFLSTVKSATILNPCQTSFNPKNFNHNNTLAAA